jgi:selenocysteine lyase/cysteine desulfurase
VIQADEERLWKRALHHWSANPHIEVLGNPGARRLSIVSLRIRHGDRYLYHNYVVALLNDLFGIQARGGCSCADPYGHRLLAIGAARSLAFRAEIGHGCEGIKPGWTRINFNYFISDAVVGYLHEARDLLAARSDHIDDGPTGLPEDFEALRWFPLPPACLAPSGRLSDSMP